MERHLSQNELDRLSANLVATPSDRLIRNAASRIDIRDVALDEAVARQCSGAFSLHLDTWRVTDQKKSGRCWLFAGTNLLRSMIARSLNITDFQLSQSYLFFWDKLEKANHWLEAVIETAQRDIDDRTVAHLLAHPSEDGGQWNMFVALVAKYGVVPLEAMPETASSADTSPMNGNLAYLLRQTAVQIRKLVLGGASESEVRAAKLDTLDVVYRLLAIHLGAPPARFQWQWRDSKAGFHRRGSMTPLDYAQEYIDVDLNDFVTLVHDPRPTSRFGSTYTVEYLGNVVEAPMVVYLNAPIDILRQAALNSITAGMPVWFGCDEDKDKHRQRGIWADRLYDYSAVYGATFGMSKADRLLSGESLMTHAMLITGVDVVEGAPTRWRVENSWGDGHADHGFYSMANSWFDENVYEVAVPRRCVPAEFGTDDTSEGPSVLPAWDPMGALAR